MPFQSVPNTVQANIRYTLNGVQAENVLHFKKGGAYVQADLDALAAAIDDWVHDSWIAHFNGSTVYRETVVTGLTLENDLQATNSTNVGDTGAGGAGQANNVTKAIMLKSGFTGRSARGRLFIIGMPSAAMATTTTMNQGFIDDLIDALLALKAIVEALGWLWVIVSRYHNGAPRATGTTFNVTTITTSDTTTDSMRSRLPQNT
jgi:hypothetical protein